MAFAPCPSDTSALLALAERLARDAARVVMAVRSCGAAVETKADATPVTEADRAAERLILAGLRAATPEIPVVAEEAVAEGRDPGPASRFWLVDPLDGTREFAAGRPEFAVNIGLVEAGRPVVGAVALPAFGEVFGGIVGVGAWKEDASGRRPIAARRVPAAGPVVFASRHHGDDQRIVAFAEAHRAARVVHAGSALKFCRVAEGVADLYPRFGATMEWDTAAPQAIVEAAGGSVTTAGGAPLRYGKPGWRNPDFLCRGRE
ncbi:3'(2'),5'-bisphosphate nucleotidase CysQ [Elioraea tepida]|uniref:3'(2'),5'-bisphosphate nucleotidase CysQ n=1 Tax=Elioraea tepida TaxID=2843330 RepID=A0A975TZN3_9PROT|nr:3'(2'),5'-bisphosphate nucleotidase CysQ [Elioraea tepida]QXM23460.1 3'(2'),5'-bisphosphate nucleotidase CysQ [Elioraea tepida]